MLSNYLIGLREGLEAALIVSILASYLVRTNRRDAFKFIWLGVGAALAVSVAIGALLTFTEQQLLEQLHAEELFAGTMSFLAVILVTYMIMWMRKAGSRMANELNGKLETALAAGVATIVLTSFAAVAREGIETTFFFFAAVKAAGETTGPIIGFALGITSAIVMGYLIYRRSIKVNLKKFFTITGYFLIVVAAGVLSYGIHEFQEIGLLPGDSSLAFNVSQTINEEGWLGAIASGLFNFDPDTTWLQLGAWVAYVGAMVWAFSREVKADTKIALELKRRS
ncbi:MAG: FTR1 family protein [Actinomycetales bacterium]|nr:FTR1 family protein [Actinomycetales bacterium]